MTPHPDSSMDERLKAYAAKRREQWGDPLELHPATHRLLQAEVAATFRGRKPARRAWWSGFRLPLPRLAYGLAVVAVLGLSVSVLKHSITPPAVDDRESPTATSADKAQFESAPPEVRDRAIQSKREERAASHASQPEVGVSVDSDALPSPMMSPEAARGVGREAPVPASAPSPRVVDDAGARATASSTVSADEAPTAVDRIATRSSAAPQPTLRPEAAPVPEGAMVSGSRADMFTLEQQARKSSPPLAMSRQPAASPPRRVLAAAPPAPEPTASRGQAAVVDSASVEHSQDFIQAPLSTSKSVGGDALSPLRVLNAFRFEHSQGQVTITDEDGSVYIGALQMGSSEGQTPARLRPGEARTALAPTRLRSADTATEVRQTSTQQPALTVGLPPAVGPTATKLPVEDYSFTATGLNRTLNAPVEFKGSFVYATSAPAPAIAVEAPTSNRVLEFGAQRYAPASTVSPAATSPSARSSAPMPISRIRGQVRVGGGTNVVLIEAVPVRP